MSKIDELIAEFCPDGVGFFKLSEIAEISGAGVDKKIVSGEKSVILLNYMDVYRNPKLTVGIPTMQVSATDKKMNQCNVLKGDVFITPSSEVKNEIGFSAVALEDMPGTVYSYHIMRVRLNEPDFMKSQFINYLFRSDILQKEISKQAKGLTRFGLTKTQWEQLRIPVPPIEVQREIVRLLDTFTELEAELEAELDARKKQYAFYRNQLFTFDESRLATRTTMSHISKRIYSGGTPKTNKTEYWENGTIPWMSSGEVNLGTVYKTEKLISEIGFKNSSAKWVPKNSVVIALAGQGKTRGMVARTRIDLTTNQSLASLTFDREKVNADYVFHFLKSQYQQLRQVSSGDGTRGGLNLQMISNYGIPIPSINEQNRIVSILDKFDKLTTDISEGLPAEINARRKQYEYYRNKLLTFKELACVKV